MSGCLQTDSTCKSTDTQTIFMWQHNLGRCYNWTTMLLSVICQSHWPPCILIHPQHISSPATDTTTKATIDVYGNGDGIHSFFAR
jgi:hypothetical protein